MASSANLRIGLGRASGSRTARTEATGGEDGDTHRAKGACQATPAVTSQGVPRGDLIGGSQKQNFKNLLRWTVLACCLPYPGDPKSAIDCFFLFGIGLHPGVTGSAPHWKFRGCRVHSFPSPQELLRPASWLALLSRTFTFELAPTRSPSISVEYDYVDKQSIPTAGLSPASPTALWAAGHRISPWKCSVRTGTLPK